MSLEGQQIDRYRIVRLLGSGGMGEVYLAEDARIEQQVALKVIRAEVSPYPDEEASQEAARLFQREAKAIAKLDHPHILPLYDYGEERLGKQTVIYLVMPYRREGSLADWLRQRAQRGLLSPQEVAHLVRQAASALQHAHTRQVIHQDVKPSNFLMQNREEEPNRPHVLLADFGVARFTSATSSMSHTIRGTPTYMAPEQWSGEPVPATDQYALAIMTYELLAGRPPFQGPPMRLMHLHAMTPPPPPSTFNPRLSGELDTVLLHALAKQPEQRFASMTAFANAFQQAVQSRPDTDAPTSREATPPSANPGDLRVVLAISTQEAQTGTTRTLTLPGGRQVTVTVPAGVYDGQLVRLEGQGDISPVGGPAGALILSILVKAAEDRPSLPTANAAATEATVLTAKPQTPTPSVPTVSNTDQQPPVGSTVRTEVVTPPNLSVSPSEAATAASQGSHLPTELALPAKPSVGRPGEMIPPTQAKQPVSVVRTGRSPQPPVLVTTQPSSFTVDRSLETLEPAQRSVSRRSVVVGLAGLAVVGVVGGLFWLAHSEQPIVSSTLGSTPIPSSSPTPLSIGTTLLTYRGHSSEVFAVAWSPDGRRIASGSDDNTVQVWDGADGGHVYTYRGHGRASANEYGVNAVAWSPDGRRIASGGGDHTVQAWDASDGGHVYTYRGHSWGVNAVAWSPDGRRIASGSDDHTVQVWNATDGGHVYTYRGHSSYVNAVAWSPDGRRIASGSDDNTVQVWDATDGGHVYTYRGHPAAVYAVAWSPDGRRIASAGNDPTIQVWDAADGGHVFTYSEYFNSADVVAWSPDGRRIASGGDNNTVLVWDATDGGHLFIYARHGYEVTALAWSPDGKRIASGGKDQTVQVWVAG
jgi:WD40 repeat protein